MRKRNFLSLFFALLSIVLLISCPTEPERPKLSTPQITPESGAIITEDTLISIKSVEEGTIYYTTDGSDPINSSTREEYTEPFKPTLSPSITIKAYAVLDGYLASDVAEATYTYTGPTSSPVLPDDKSIPFTSIKLEVLDGTKYYYNLSNEPPTANSTEAKDGVIDLSTLEGNEVTVTVIAKKEGLKESTPVTKTYSKLKLSTPQITPESHLFEKEFTVAITQSEGGTVYYTTDGSDPSDTSTKYESEFPITKACVLKAIAYKDGCIASDVVTVDYSGNIPAPTFSIESGSTIAFDTITISSTVSGVTFHYTLNSGEEKTSTDGVIDISSAGDSATISVYATKEGYTKSETVSATYTKKTLSMPKISPDSQMLTEDITVTITSEDEGVAIYYTTNGTEPHNSSYLYSEPFKVTDACTVKAIAVLKGCKDSPIASVQYTANTPQPKITPSNGVVPFLENNIEIVADGANDKIYYTTDGKTPTEAPTYYAGTGKATITVKKAATLKVIAVRPNSTASDVVTLNIKQASVPAPTVTYDEYFIAGSSKVTIKAEEGVTVTYQIGDSEWLTYSDPFTISDKGLVTLSYRAEKEGYATYGNHESVYVYQLLSGGPINLLDDNLPYVDIVKPADAIGNGTIYYTTDGTDPGLNASNTITDLSKLDYSSDITLKALYFDRSNYEISPVSTIKVAARGDKSGLYGNWFSQDPSETITIDNDITIYDSTDNSYIHPSYEVSADKFVSYYKPTGMTMTLTISGEDLVWNEVTLTKSATNSYAYENTTVGAYFYNLSSKAVLKINNVYYVGTVTGDSTTGYTLSVDYFYGVSDYATNGPLSLGAYYILYRKPEVTFTIPALEVGVEAEASITVNTYSAEGIKFGQVKYVILESDQTAGTETEYTGSIKIKRDSDAAFRIIAHLPVTYSSTHYTTNVIFYSDFCNAKYKLGLPYVGPYTVLTDSNSIETTIRDFESTAGNFHRVVYEDTVIDVDTGYPSSWNYNYVLGPSYLDYKVKVHGESAKATAVFTRKSSTGYIPSDVSKRVFYKSDETGLTGTYTATVDMGSGTSSTYTLTVSEGLNYTVAVGDTTAYSGKAYYNSEQKMILINYKDDNRLGFDETWLNISYDSSSDTLTVNGVDYYRVSGDGTGIDGYWFEVGDTNQFLRGEVAIDSSKNWISFRNTLRESSKDVYIYEGKYTINESGCYVISGENTIDNYYILTPECLSADGNTLSVAGLTFTKSTT